jgi:hypothetical protein
MTRIDGRPAGLQAPERPSRTKFAAQIAVTGPDGGTPGIQLLRDRPGRRPDQDRRHGFAPEDAAHLLVTDVGDGAIYRIDHANFGFDPGQAYSASDNAGVVGTLDLDTGTVTPIVTGLTSARGLQFVRHPENGEHREHADQ